MHSRPRTTLLLACIALSAAAITGCIGDPDAIGSASSFGTDRSFGTPVPTIDRELWEGAPAGCEDAPTDAYLVRTEGEPMLGALIDRQGRVLCVDSLTLIEAELEFARLPRGDYGADPSPQPSHPGDAEAGFRAARAAEGLDGTPMHRDEP